jgi:hypothetical protein
MRMLHKPVLALCMLDHKLQVLLDIRASQLMSQQHHRTQLGFTSSNNTYLTRGGCKSFYNCQTIHQAADAAQWQVHKPGRQKSEE